MYHKNMTEIEKKTIREMRFRGFGYKKIAKDLGLKRDTIRDYCRCHKLVGKREDFLAVMVKEAEAGLVCRNCGFKIEQPARGKRIFCSPRCMYRYKKFLEEREI